MEHKKGIDEKPSWDSFFLASAYLVAQRSIDESTLCGALIVGQDNRVLSQGYNGPIANSIDNQIPQERPAKYSHFLHAEENAILNFNGSFKDLRGSTIYVTNRPCSKCLRMILQKGIYRIVYPKSKHARCVDKEDIKAQEQMIKNLKFVVEMVEYNTTKNILYLLNRAKEYAKECTEF